MNAARFALDNAKVFLFLTLVLTALGIRAYLVTPQSIFPTMTFSRVEIVAEAGDLPPDRVRTAIAIPLETAVQQLPGVLSVRSTASQGSADLVVNFDPQTAPQIDAQLVSERLAQIRAAIPDVTRIVSVVVTPNSEPVLSYALVPSTLSTAVTRELAVRDVEPRLFGLSGLGRILISGGPSEEIHVELDAAKLATSGIGAVDVVRAISDANTVRGVGVQNRYAQQYAIVLDSSLSDVASIGRIGVPGRSGAAIPIAALGTVALGVATQTDGVSFGARPAVSINAYPANGADTVVLAQRFRDRLGAIERRIPTDIAVKQFWDQTSLIVASQASLRDAIFIGAAIAVVVIYLFLRDYRLTLVAAGVIPVAMAIAVFGLQLGGQTLNLMSVGGLAIAVGLIIDDAIVVVEGIERTMHEHPDLAPREAIETAVGGLIGAMTSSTLTAVVVFLPLGLLGGVTGFFFRALAFTMGVSLLVSLLLAVYVAPSIALRLFRTPAEPKSEDGIGRVLARYDHVLRFALEHRAIVFVTSGVILAITVVLLSRLPSEFLPQLDEGHFEVSYAMPTGTSLAATEAASRDMERIVMADPGVATVGRLTGIDSNGYSPTPQNRGLLRVALVDPGKRLGYVALSNALRDRLQAAIPAAAFDFHQILEDLIHDLSGTPAPIEIALRGSDQRTLVDLAEKLTDALGNVPGLVDVNSGVVYDSPSIALAPRTARLAALGIGTTDLGDALAASSSGTVATSIGNSTQQFPVRVSLGPRAPDLGAAPLALHNMSSSVADLTAANVHRQATDENDENGERVIRVTANVGNARFSDAIAGVQRVLAQHPAPPGYTQEIGGDYQTQKASFAEFERVIVIALLLVYAVVLATFRSFRVPLIIITAVPLALFGVAIALFATGTPINVSSIMGVLLLVGIVVKNGILLIDVANHARAGGANLEDALVAAGRTRLRPILMTTLAAIGGLVPLALGIGQGSELQRPLAIAVIGGLSTATLFTLVLIPVLYATFFGEGARAGAEVPA